MATKLNAREASFETILKFKPSVPQLQRNYSWSQQEWGDLWDDLTGFCEDKSVKGRPYFIGTIVLEEHDDSYRILDGQQRLATLTILVGALTQKLSDLGFADVASAFERDGLVNPRRPDDFF